MTRYIVTGVLIALFAALLAYAKFHEKGEVPKKSEEKPIPVFPIKKADIQRLEWHRTDGGFACVRDGKRWRFEAPAGVRLDREKLDSVLDAVADMEATREIGGGANPSDFGLDSPSFSLKVGLAGGKSATLLAGDETPTGEKAYIGINGGKRILIADTWRVDQLRKEADDLRDRSVVEFDREKVSAIAAEGGGAAVRCVKDQKGAWRLEGRKKSCEGEASAVLSTLKYAEVKEFPPADEAVEDLMGPEKEIYVLKLELSGINSRIIRIGKHSGDDLYIYNTDRREIHKISDTLAKDVKELLKLAGENDEKKENEDGTKETAPD